MPSYTQADRPVAIDTPLGTDALLLQSVVGVEGVSLPFHFVADLASTDDSVSADELLRQPVCIRLRLERGERIFHGLVSRFVQLGQSGDLTRYEAEIVPWLWFLSLSRDCRIFQNLTVPEIVEQVFSSQGYSDFDMRCIRSYPKREYCVQYRETHLDFVSRLLEEEGIFYFFEHDGSKHTMVLADASNSLKPCPGGAVGRVKSRNPDGEEVITTLRREHVVHIGSVALRDYDHLQPSLSLHGAMSGDGREEVYDYSGGFTTLEDGERYARLRLEAEEAMRQQVRGEATCRTFQSGFRMTVKEHYRSDINREYLLLQVQHSASVGDYRTTDEASADYRNSFVAIPHDAPYHPPRATPKPTVRGTQTAVVVGKSGEEIWVDSHGRVKVQFHWDREGQKNENSSCWVRVSANWAGKGWGAIQIPRIGQEVIVDFLEGDPDRPIIIGRVYNADHTPPYALPGNQTQSGIKSRSSKGGGTDNFNEIRMEDKKGSELLYLHAEKDEQTVVENDRRKSVGNDETVSVGNDRTESVGKDESVSIGKNQTLSVGANQTVSVGKNRSVDVADNDAESVGKDRTSDIGKNASLSIGDSWTVTVAKDHREQAGKNYGLVAKQVIIEGQDSVVIKSGSASITLKKNGDIQIQGGKINIKGSKDVVVKGSKVLEN